MVAAIPMVAPLVVMVATILVNMALVTLAGDVNGSRDNVRDNDSRNNNRSNVCDNDGNSISDSNSRQKTMEAR